MNMRKIYIRFEFNLILNVANYFNSIADVAVHAVTKRHQQLDKMLIFTGTLSGNSVKLFSRNFVMQYSHLTFSAIQ